MEPETVHAVYLDLIEEITADEEQLQTDLPIDTPAGVPTFLQALVDRWSDGKKSLRTTPVVNVYACELQTPPDPAMLRILVGLDAQINVFDDIIDTRELSTEQRVALTANAAMAPLLVAGSIPPAHRQAITTVLREYFTALFQIPLVEARLFEKMDGCTTPTARRETAQEMLAYRAQVVDAFVQIPAILSGLDTEVEKRPLTDLRAYKARQLLVKDIYDVPRDLDDDDMTAVIALLSTDDAVETVTDEVVQIYDHFEYTATGQSRYGDVLDELVEMPDDLGSLLEQQQQLVHAAAK